MSRPTLAAIDTVVLIDILIGKSNLARAMDLILRDAARGLCKLLVSEVSVAEVAKLGSETDVEELVSQFLSNQFCIRYPVTPAVSSKASMLIRDYSLDTCDALITATAIVHHADILYTHDGSMRKKIRKSQNAPLEVPTEVSGLQIRSPLFDHELCSEAGMKFGEAYCKDVNKRNEEQAKQAKEADKDTEAAEETEASGA